MIQYRLKRGKNLQKEQAPSAKLKSWPLSEAVKKTTIRRYFSSWGNWRSKWRRHSQGATCKKTTLSRIRQLKNSTLIKINSRLSSSKPLLSIWMVKTKRVNVKRSWKLKIQGLILTRSPKSKSRLIRVLTTVRFLSKRKRFLSLPLNNPTSTPSIRPTLC
jgi:hypothetical protein